MALVLDAAESGPHLQKAARLHASVDLECPYIRQLVLEAFARRPEWSAVHVSCTGEEIAPAARSTLLHWGEYERICWDAVHRGAQWASAYCVRKGLTRKAHLAHNARKWAAKHPGGRLARAVPETWPLELHDPEYVDEALCDVPEVRDMADGSAVWIAKPSITNQATGICIFDRAGTLRAALEASEDLREWVLQRYIDRPLLVRGRKFHIRAYVLCVGSLAVHVYSEALALFAGRPYAGAPLTDLAAHLTNTCRARRDALHEGGGCDAERPGLAASDAGVTRCRAAQSAGGIEVVKGVDGTAAGSADSTRGLDGSRSRCSKRDAGSGSAAAAQESAEAPGGAASGAGGSGGARDREAGQESAAAVGASSAGGELHGAQCDAGWCEEDAVRLVSELPQLLAAEGLALEEAEARVRQLTSDVHAVLGECLEAVSGELSFFTLPTCFELFGFDLVVDEDWHVWLLEANAEPDVSQTGSRLRPLVAGLVEGVLALVADPLAHAAGTEAACSAPCADGLHPAGEEGRLQQGAQEKCVQHAKESAPDALLLGRWVKLWDKRQPGRGMASGMRMM